MGVNRARVRQWLGAAALAATAYKAVTLSVNALTFPRLDRTGPPPGRRQDSQPRRRHQRSHGSHGEQQQARRRPTVSLLTPARNEAHHIPQLLGGLLAQGADEVILLDDHSDDGTGELARARCQGVPGARVIRGTPLPPGWTGKNWACFQLAQAASGDVLIFVDADVIWHPGALEPLLAELERSGADLLSCWPRHEVQTAGERLVTPMIDSYLLTLLPFPAMRLPLTLTATAVGQVMVFRRAAYQAVGGHRLVQKDVLEDVLFAKRLKARGYRVSGVLGGQRIGVRMYSSYSDSVAGYAKSWLPVHGNSRLQMVGGLLAQVGLLTLPWLIPLPGGRWLRLASVVERGAVAWVAGRRQPADLLEGLLGPVQPIIMLPIYRRALQKKVSWKGREYVQ